MEPKKSPDWKRKIIFQLIIFRFYSFYVTLPETNIAREHRPQEKEIPIGNHHF